MKKFLMLAACLMLLGTITVNGTFAFSLSDLLKDLTDLFGAPTPAAQEQLNIETLIQMRSGNTLVADQGQMLVPANLPDDFNWENEKTETGNVGGNTYRLWTFPGAVDKFISVKNNTVQSADANSAYFRTAISICCSDAEVWSKLKLNLNTSDFKWTDWKTTKDGQYRTAIATYKEALAPGETSPAMMLQIALDKSITSEQMTKFGSEFRIEVNTVAIDTETFKNQDGLQMSAQDALNLALPLETF